MEKIIIEATEQTPAIEFDFAGNKFLIKGESYPENVSEFFGSLMEKLVGHLRSQAGANISFVFELDYFNSSSASILMDIFDLLEEVAAAGNDVVVTWCYEEDDDNIEELGEEFGEDLEAAKFELKKIEI